MASGYNCFGYNSTGYVNPCATPAVTGGGGAGWAHYEKPRRENYRNKSREEISRLVRQAIHGLERSPAPAAVQEVAAVKVEFAAPRATSQPPRIDYEALLADAARVQSILALYDQVIREQQEEEEAMIVLMMMVAANDP